MTKLQQLYEVYPADPRATMPFGLRVDGAAWAVVDGADLLTGEVTTAETDVQTRTAIGKLTHVIASAGFDFGDLQRVTAYVSPDADLARVTRVWEAANPESGGRARFELREAHLAAGRQVVLEALAALPDAPTNFETTSILVDAPASAVRLGPVLYVPALTTAGHDGTLPDGIAAQVTGAFDNLDRLLDATGVDRHRILRIAGYMRDLKDKDYLNNEMVARFPVWAEKPVHKYVPAALPPGVEFALQVIAVDGAERSILEIDGIEYNDPISLGAQVGNVFVSSASRPASRPASKPAPASRPRASSTATRAASSSTSAAAWTTSPRWSGVSATPPSRRRCAKSALPTGSPIVCPASTSSRLAFPTVLFPASSSSPSSTGSRGQTTDSRLRSGKRSLACRAPATRD